MTFQPAPPANAIAAAALRYSACNDFLDIGANGESVHVITLDCRSAASDYICAWDDARPVQLDDAAYAGASRALTDWMVRQCIAYAYYLDMNA